MAKQVSENAVKAVVVLVYINVHVVRSRHFSLTKFLLLYACFMMLQLTRLIATLLTVTQSVTFT